MRVKSPGFTANTEPHPAPQGPASPDRSAEMGTDVSPGRDRTIQARRQPATFTTEELTALASRFWSKVDRSAGDEACWPWAAARALNGYGQWHPRAGTHTPAHRFALALKLGRSLGQGEQAMHLCENPPCCNPRHLEAGTPSENMKYAARPGNKRYSQRPRPVGFLGELNPMAVLTDEQVIELRGRAASNRSHGWMADEAKRLGVSGSAVRAAISGDSFSHLPGALPDRHRRIPGPGMCINGHDVVVVGRYANGRCSACGKESTRQLRLAAEARSPRPQRRMGRPPGTTKEVMAARRAEGAVSQ